MPAFSLPPLNRRLLPADSPADVAEVLGPRHPLTRACELQIAVTRQLAALGAVAAISGGAALLSRALRAQSLSLVALGFMPALGIVLVVPQGRVRSQAALLVLKGLEGVPLALVAEERERLLSAASRERLACRFEVCVRERARPTWVDAAPAWLRRHPRLAHAVRPELLHVAELVRAPRQHAQGIAFAEAVLAQGVLIAADRDEALLRGELRRVIEMLSRP